MAGLFRRPHTESLPACRHPPAQPTNQMARKLSLRGKENGTSLSAATGGSKDSLYTVQDPALASLPAAPTHRIAASQQQQVAAYDRYGNVDAYASRSGGAQMAWA